MRRLLLSAVASLALGAAAQAQTVSGSAGGTLGQGFAGVTSGSGVQGWSGINGAAAAFSQGGSIATMAGEMPGGIGGSAYSFQQGAGTAVGDQAAAGFQGHSGGDAWGGASWTAYGFTMPGTGAQ